jgi:hypothetical protein
MSLGDEFRKAKSWRITYKGQEIWLEHQFPVDDGQRVRITIESFDPDWGGLGEKRLREGVTLLIDKRMELEQNPCHLLFIWPSPLPVEELHPTAEKPRRVGIGSVYEEAGIEGRLCLWLDDPFRPIEIVCRTQDGHIHVSNAWNFGDMRKGIHFQHYGAGMIVEAIEDGFRYHCNDGYPDEDFDDIVFRIERFEE